jgi:hypothetical protein
MSLDRCPVTDFAQQLDHADLRDFHAYWLSKRCGKRVPARADIDPVELQRFLPNIFMMDVIDGGARFRYRLIGTAVGTALGDYSGRYVDEALAPPHYALYHAKYLRVVRELAMSYAVVRIFWQEGPPVLFSRLMLPLSDDQASANILFGLGYYDFGSHKPRTSRHIDSLARLEYVTDIAGLPPPADAAPGSDAQGQGASGGS